MAKCSSSSCPRPTWRPKRWICGAAMTTTFDGRHGRAIAVGRRRRHRAHPRHQQGAGDLLALHPATMPLPIRSRAAAPPRPCPPQLLSQSERGLRYASIAITSTTSTSATRKKPGHHGADRESHRRHGRSVAAFWNSRSAAPNVISSALFSETDGVVILGLLPVVGGIGLIEDAPEDRDAEGRVARGPSRRWTQSMAIWGRPRLLGSYLDWMANRRRIAAAG